MKSSTLLMLLVAITLCMLCGNQALAQTTFSYATLDYDEETNSLHGYAYTQPAYSVSLYYFTTFVEAKILDESNNELAHDSRQANGSTVELNSDASGNGSDDYTMLAGHAIYETIFVNNYPQPGGTATGYLDFYNYQSFEGQQPISADFSITTTGPGPDIVTSSTFRFLGQIKVVASRLVLRASGTIEPAPENEDYVSEKAAAGGTDLLGPLPMGDGRAEFPGQAYTAPIMVIGKISPPSAYSETYRWQRFVALREWHIRFDVPGDRWVVTQKRKRGIPTPEDDTGSSSFNDSTPSTSTGKVYIYDNSAITFGTSSLDKVNDCIRSEKSFLYRLERMNSSGTWVRLTSTRIGQIANAKRQNTTGSVASDWLGLENSNAKRTLDMLITEAEVRSLVGGTKTIHIDPTANN